MKMSFRWYGESDPISLQYISQIPGMRSIVSAVYDVKPGEVWGEDSLAKMKKQCEDNGLVFDVVESIPVHEDIKLGRNNVDELLEVYCENIRRCAKYGVKCGTYNFMPVFDWTRTQLDKVGEDESLALIRYLFTWDTTELNLKYQVPRSSLAKAVQKEVANGKKFHETLGVIPKD